MEKFDLIGVRISRDYELNHIKYFKADKLDDAMEYARDREKYGFTYKLTCCDKYGNHICDYDKVKENSLKVKKCIPCLEDETQIVIIFENGLSRIFNLEGIEETLQKEAFYNELDDNSKTIISLAVASQRNGIESEDKAEIKFLIPYDNEFCYCIVVNEQDKAVASELVNKAYNEFLENDEIYDFQVYASQLLTDNEIEFEFSIWNEEEIIPIGLQNGRSR